MSPRRQKDRNDKFCCKGDVPVKIRGWQKKCGSCEHGVFVAIRGCNSEDEFICLDYAYLFRCPHVQYLRTDLVLTPIEIAVDLLNDDMLEWKKFRGKSIADLRKIEIAIIPRNKWFEILLIPEPRIKPCPKCKSPEDE